MLSLSWLTCAEHGEEAVTQAVVAALTSASYEAETLTRTASAAGSKVTSETGASSGAYVQSTGTPAVGAWIQFTLPNVAAGTYDVAMLYKSNTNRAIVQASIDGINQGAPCDEYASSPAFQVRCSLGTATLSTGNHLIRLRVTGKRSSSTGYLEVIDQISLTASGGGSGTGGWGGGAGGVGGTAGTAAAYSPCPVPPALCKILPFGDSITLGVGSNGSGSNGGYRVELFHRANVDGKAITFVGTAAPNGPNTVDGLTFPRQHEGHSGYTIDNVAATSTTAARSGIAPLVPTVMPATKPDIVTLMIGTNDVQHDIDVANAPVRLGKLIDSIIATDAHTLVVVAQIVPTTDANVNMAVQAYNNAIPALINSRVAAGKHVVLVDLYHPIASAPGFQTSGATVPDNTVGPMYDWLHPNVAGYKIIGDTWYEAIKSALR